MLERIYLDNVLTFVNFEWKPGPLAILLGENGAGKSGLFKVLSVLTHLLRGDQLLPKSFPASSRTRWESRPRQIVELEVRTAVGLYRYRLVVEHDAEDEELPIRITEESLRLDEQSLVQFTPGDLRLYSDQGGEFLRTSGVPTQSALHLMQPAKSLQRIAGFLNLLGPGLAMFRPNPPRMLGRIKEGAAALEPDLKNFSSWYVASLASTPSLIFLAQQALKEVLPGFRELYVGGGYLRARFATDKHVVSYRFDELSDGQRALIALYVLRHVHMQPGNVVLFDEPDNYLALREIQPWLTELVDATLVKDGPQVMIISHHPEVINLLTPDYGWRFYRDEGGPTRVERFSGVTESGLLPAEIIARGWEEK